MSDEGPRTITFEGWANPDEIDEGEVAGLLDELAIDDAEWSTRSVVVRRGSPDSRGTAERTNPDAAQTIERAIADAIERATADLAVSIGAITISKEHAAARLGVSVDHLEKHVMPEIRTIRSGSRVLIPVDELADWVGSHKARALREP